MRLARKLMCVFCFVLLVIQCGCSSQKPISITDLGNQILETVGFIPAKSAFTAGENLLSGTDSVTKEEEYYLGRGVAARILSIYPPSQDRALNDYVNRVGYAVVAFSDQPETFGGYHFIVLDTDEINSMAAPGGFIFITKGFLKIMPDEDALAAVLAHEVSHVTKEHGLTAIKDAKKNETLTAVAKLASSLTCNEVLAQATNLFGSLIDDMVLQLIEKGYSRDQEYEADAEGVIILRDTGYNAHAMLLMLDAVESKQAVNSKGWFATHPDTKDRILKVEELLASANIPVNTKGKVERAKRFDQEGRARVS